MNTVYIYTLSDVNGNIRYVGKTNNLLARYQDHLSEALRRKSITYKNNWLFSLLSNNSVPMMEIIDEVNEADWTYWESYWIAQCKQWGFNLTNGSEGGENPPSFLGKTHSESYKEVRKNFMLSDGNPAKGGLSDEWKKKISDSNKGRKWTEAQKENFGKTVIQYSLNNEFIREWASPSIAGRSLNININGIILTCNGKRNKSGNFKWQYK